MLSRSLPPIAGIILIVGAGGGFKQTLIDTGIAEVVADFVPDSGVSVLLLPGWSRWSSASPRARPPSPPSPPPASWRRSRRTSPARKSRCWCWPSVRDRSSSPTSTMPGSGWSRSTSVCGSADPQELVDHGDGAVGHRPGGPAGAQPRGLSEPSAVANRVIRRGERSSHLQLAWDDADPAPPDVPRPVQAAHRAGPVLPADPVPGQPLPPGLNADIIDKGVVARRHRLHRAHRRDDARHHADAGGVHDRRGLLRCPHRDGARPRPAGGRVRQGRVVCRARDGRSSAPRR